MHADSIFVCAHNLNPAQRRERVAALLALGVRRLNQLQRRSESSPADGATEIGCKPVEVADETRLSVVGRNAG